MPQKSLTAAYPCSLYFLVLSPYLQMQMTFLVYSSSYIILSTAVTEGAPISQQLVGHLFPQAGMHKGINPLS